MMRFRNAYVSAEVSNLGTVRPQDRPASPRDPLDEGVVDTLVLVGTVGGVGEGGAHRRRPPVSD